MNKIEVAKRVYRHGIRWVKKNLPMILSVGAGIGVAVTVYEAVKETPKAVEKIKEKEKLDPDMTTLQKVAVGAPEMKATIIAFLVTEGMLVASTGSWMKKVAGFSVLYSAVVADKETKEKALKAAEELIGKEKMDALKKQVGLETSDGYTAEKTAKRDNTPKFGRNEIRPCRCKLTGAICRNSYNGLVAGMEDSIEEAKTYGIVSMGDVLYRCKFPDGDIGSMMVFDKDLDFNIVETTIDGAVGWELNILQDPVPDYDSRVSFG